MNPSLHIPFETVRDFCRRHHIRKLPILIREIQFLADLP